MLRSAPSFLRKRSSSGFSLFELVVVLVIVAILFSVLVARYESKISQSQDMVISFQANAFLRSVENVRAISTIQNSDEVDLGDGVIVYLNQFGWPMSSNYSSDKRPQNSSQGACKSLWKGLFSDAITKKQDGNPSIEKNFEISLINNYICRYKLVRKKEGSYFFDYDVRTGSVVISSTEL